MIIGGETWACDGCVRGHRTSSCQHQDRPLQLIKKKGRPVSQCDHCRSMRQSRSAHVKCDCAKRAREGRRDDGNKDLCRCFEDGRCNCALKRSPLDASSRSGSEEGATNTGSSGGSCCQGQQIQPSTSFPVSEMPSLMGADSWNQGILDPPQLPQGQAHQFDSILSNAWTSDLSNTIEGDPQPHSSFDFTGLQYLSTLDEFTDFNSFPNTHSAPFAGLPDTTQHTLDAHSGASFANWIQNNHVQGHGFGIAGSAWPTNLPTTDSNLELPQGSGTEGENGKSLPKYSRN